MKNDKVDLSPSFLSHHLHLKTIQSIKFTSRERDGIACLLSKKGSKAIAPFLSNEEKTVETHKYKLLLVKRPYLRLLIQEVFEKPLQKWIRELTVFYSLKQIFIGTYINDKGL